MDSVPERPHFAYPFQRGASGGVNAVEQDTVEHVTACENVIVRCPLGWREERPEFGWPWPEFHPAPLPLGPLQAALRQFEPRGNTSAVEYADVVDASIRYMQVDVEVSG